MEHNESLPVGTILDSGVRQYKIQSVLGKGGFGITYLATSTIYVDNIPLDGQFAIKEHYISSMNERQGTSVSISNVNNTEEINESIDSFLVEAKRLNKLSLNHNGLVRVNESFRANGTAYYVMEYIKGKSLRDYVKHSPQGKLGEDEALQLFRPIAETIGYLHDNMVTHLDIKPDNILIRENGEPVIIDFGLSKHYSAKGTPTSTIKAAGCSAGYSPMEQYAGITTFSPEADVYALGATLFYMLTGKDPMISTEINESIIRRSIPTNISSQTIDAIVHAMEKLKDNRTDSVRDLINKTTSDSSESDIRPVGKDNEDIRENERVTTPQNSNVTKKMQEFSIHRRYLSKWWVGGTLGFAVVITLATLLNTNSKDSLKVDTTIIENQKIRSEGFLTDYEELSVGDYYYEDGTYSHDLISSKRCVGMVFSTETSEKDKNKGWSHGYIVAMEDVENGKLFSWGFKRKSGTGNVYVEFYKDVINDYNGYENTMKYVKEGIPAACAATNYSESVVLPSNTSGWYLPSAGQWKDIIQNICGIKLKYNEGGDWWQFANADVALILKEKLNIDYQNHEMIPRYDAGAATVIPWGPSASGYWTSTVGREQYPGVSENHPAAQWNAMVAVYGVDSKLAHIHDSSKLKHKMKVRAVASF